MNKWWFGSSVPWVHQSEAQWLSPSRLCRLLSLYDCSTLCTKFFVFDAILLGGAKSQILAAPQAAVLSQFYCAHISFAFARNTAPSGRSDPNDDCTTIHIHIKF